MPPSHAAAPRPTACSSRSSQLDEPLAGTAPFAGRWLAVEQPGPWGARALTASHFPQELGRALALKAEAAGVRVALIRRPGMHAEHDAGTPRRIFLADTRPGRTALWSWTTADPATLLDLDFEIPGKPEHEGGPLLLVCTNAKRDECCAVSGRALVAWLAEDAHTETAAVWESDHLGGHRFAPTAVLLPTGYVYGRLDGPAAREVLRRATSGQVTADRCRGRSTWSRAGQAAELALRAELQEFSPDAVHVLGERSLDPLPGAPAQPAGAVEVDENVDVHEAEAASVATATSTDPGEPRRHDEHRYEVSLAAAGGRFRVVVAEAPAAEPRPESCGKAPGQPLELRVLRVEKQA
jgi:hypothetical protein